MDSLEFTTRIDHGVIHLPKDYADVDSSLAHVVVTFQNSDDEKQARKNRLFETMRKMQEVKVFRGIEDPSEWQRRLRDEWD